MKVRAKKKVKKKVYVYRVVPAVAVVDGVEFLPFNRKDFAEESAEWLRKGQGLAEWHRNFVARGTPIKGMNAALKHEPHDSMWCIVRTLQGS